MFEVAVAVAAAVIAWIVLNVVGVQDTIWKWIIIAAVFVAAIIAAILAVRKVAPDQGRGVAVGDRVRGREVEISKIDVDPAGTSNTSVSIGNDVRSRRKATIRDVSVKKKP